MLFLRPLVAGLSPRWSGFLRQSLWNMWWTRFSPSTPVSPVGIIPPVLHTHISFFYHRRLIIIVTASVSSCLSKRGAVLNAQNITFPDWCMWH